jgi:hypothetical protein
MSPADEDALAIWRADARTAHDINNEVSTNQVWDANVTTLASGNFLNTRYGNGSVNPNLGLTSPQTLYEEAAWIITQFASHPDDYVSLQYALWDLMTPGAEPTSFANADGTTTGSVAGHGRLSAHTGGLRKALPIRGSLS